MRIRRLVLVLVGVLLFSFGAFAQTYGGGPRSYDRGYSTQRRDDHWRENRRHERKHHKRHERREHRRHHDRDHNNYRHDGYRR